MLIIVTHLALKNTYEPEKNHSTPILKMELTQF